MLLKPCHLIVRI